MSKLLDLFDDLTGVVLDYALSTPPSAKWLMCYGQPLVDGDAVTARLRDKLIADGFPHGQDAGGNPRVPDVRGRTTAGKDNMGGTAAGRLTAAVSGVAGDTLGANGGDQRTHGHTHTGSGKTTGNGSHAHTGGGTTSWEGDHAHGYVDTHRGFSSGGSNIATGSGYSLTTSTFNRATDTAGGHNHTYSLTTSNADNHTHDYSFTTSQTGDGASQNVQPTLVLNKIIRL